VALPSFNSRFSRASRPVSHFVRRKRSPALSYISFVTSIVASSALLAVVTSRNCYRISAFRAKQWRYIPLAYGYRVQFVSFTDAFYANRFSRWKMKFEKNALKDVATHLFKTYEFFHNVWNKMSLEKSKPHFVFLINPKQLKSDHTKTTFYCKVIKCFWGVAMIIYCIFNAWNLCAINYKFSNII